MAIGRKSPPSHWLPDLACLKELDRGLEQPPPPRHWLTLGTAPQPSALVVSV